MNKTLSFALLCAIAFTLTACGPDFSTPEGAVKAYHKAMEAQDEEALKLCLIKAERESAKKSEDKDKSETKDDGGSWEVGAATVDGDKAKVPVTYTDKDGKKNTLNYVCMKEEGEWKVSMMATVFGGLGDAMKDAFKAE